MPPAVPSPSRLQPPRLQRLAAVATPGAALAPPPCAVAIGTFDGVHLGHQALLARLRAAARARGLEATVLTFEPAPREWFARRRGETPPARIASLRTKVARLAAAGVERVCVARFGEAMSALDPETFVADVLVRRIGARHLMVGDDFRFGARRAGDFALLQRLGLDLGYTVERLDSVVADDGVRISSSAVRARLAEGDLAGAAWLLGARWRIDGRVIHGAKLGRTLGFPTLNVRVPTARPAAAGIFVVAVHGLGPQPMHGVASLGTRPAVEADGRMLLEVHLLDWNGDAYGRCVGIEFLHKLRDEMRWDGPDALAQLTAQIRRDALDARDWFAEHQPAAVAGAA